MWLVGLYGLRFPCLLKIFQIAFVYDIATTLFVGNKSAGSNISSDNLQRQIEPIGNHIKRIRSHSRFGNIMQNYEKKVICILQIAFPYKNANYSLLWNQRENAYFAKKYGCNE